MPKPLTLNVAMLIRDLRLISFPRPIVCARLLLVLAIILAACSPGKPAAGPAETVEAYLQALVAGDVNRMISLSCASREAEVRQEFNSFAAVKLSLKDVSCQPSTEAGDSTIVNCTGSIVANYGNEAINFDLQERPYMVKQEGGEWRVCGYGQR